ncbi:hypothetical protein RND81_07G085700 [Saponaria officinalis]|uniref:Uncharacterized protein n=1 Tax=Saponaria officinalis TaxID=3572 RepID=A0AAW1JT56_SAPOF
MDKRVMQLNKEWIKTTMLTQDRTLKEQVRELHRLYHVQKKLMEQQRGTEQLPHSLNSVDTQDYITLVDYFDLERQSLNDNEDRDPDTTDRPSASTTAEDRNPDTTDRPSASTTAGIGDPRSNDGDDGGRMVDLELSIGFGGGNSTKETDDGGRMVDLELSLGFGGGNSTKDT